MNPESVVLEARQWLNVPFRHQGRDGHGIDCVGLPIVVCRSLGLIGPEYDIANYGRLPSAELLMRLQVHCTPLPPSKPLATPGALIVIAWSRLAAHVAICTGETMIHAYERVGRVIEHGYRGRWVRMTHSVWALPGVRYE